MDGPLVLTPVALSFRQEMILRSIEDGNDADHITTTVFSLPTPVDRDALRAALNGILARHDVLRATFPAAQTELQWLRPAESFLLAEAVLQEGQTVDAFALQELSKPFVLAAGPLLRGTLLKITDERYLLLFTAHELVCDRASMELIASEIFSQHARDAGDSCVETIRRHRSAITSDALESQQAYWTSALSAVSGLVDLAGDWPRLTRPVYTTARVGVHLRAHVVRELQAKAASGSLALPDVLRLSWAAFLARWSGQHDIVIGTRIRAFPATGAIECVGPFENTLALRFRFQESSTVEELFADAKSVVSQAYAHPDVPFGSVRRSLKWPAEAAPRMFVDIVDRPRPLSMSMDVRSAAATRQHELALTLYLQDGAISGFLEYACDLFEQETAERIVGSWQTLVERMVSRAPARFAELPLLSAAMRSLVLQGFNSTKTEFPQDRRVHEMFESQVARSPDAVAVAYQDSRLTFAQLNARSNQLARYLRAAGVGTGRRVALCVERGPELLVGLLGILKTGAAYVPLDSSYPADRIAYVLDDSAPSVLLTLAHLKPTLPHGSLPVLALDADWPAIAAHSSENLPAQDLAAAEEAGDSRDIAYVIYTSGSTGRPKGVAVEHRSVVNLLCSMARSTGIRAADRLLAVTTIAFDIAALELYLPLICGARVVLADRSELADPQQLSLLIDQQRATVMQATPATWRMLLENGWEGASGLTALCGGEALPTELAEKLRPRVRQLWNVYGPTETTIWSTIESVDVVCEAGTRRPATQPIGAPIANTQIYILRGAGEVAPIGVPGEIHIGGVGVARGYWNRPELTAERFIPDPFRDAHDARLYRTGDLARWLKDGRIEYLGRNDHQVKVRGHRIELGEIESVLMEHGNVRQAVVVAREDSPGDKRLVAYVVGDRTSSAQQGGVATEELRSHGVGSWEAIWRETYAAHDRGVGPTFAGWQSSYTGRPIPEEEMQEWLGHTVQRIRALSPKRVLEIGCGVGLLVQHVAPTCDAYVGTDFSLPAIEQLQKWLGSRDGFRHVELQHRSATQLMQMPRQSFDTVVLNSVVQYFPDLDYLMRVLRDAVALLAGHGNIFIGDVRHFGLLRLFHNSVGVRRAPAGTRVAQLREHISRALADESELVIDPRFFETLPEVLAGVTAVDVQLKRGHALNELTQFRYDVVLHVGTSTESRVICPAMPWQSDFGSLEILERALEQRHWSAFRVERVSNARLAADLAVQQLIDETDPGGDVASVRNPGRAIDATAIDPEAMCRLGERHGYIVSIGWAAAQEPGYFSASFIDRERAASLPREVPERVRRESSMRGVYANDPTESQFNQQLIQQLRECVRARLPDYMLPSAWMLLKSLPLTPNGKVDRRALPAPRSRPEELPEYVVPATEMERKLADVWSKVLQVDQVSARDNFFELGGHSLLIVQMIGKLRQLGLAADVRSIYTSPTLSDLARVLAPRSAETEVPENRIPLACDTITPDMLPLVDLSPAQIEAIATSVPGGAANIQDIYPLTPLQEGILFHRSFNERGDAYVLSTLLEVPSQAKRDALIEALQLAIGRHDALRTAVLWESLPQPLQVVYREARISVQTLAPGTDPVRELRERMDPRHVRLDVAKAPMLSVQMAPAVDGAGWYVLLQLHHLICDHVSLQAMLAEIVAHLAGRTRELAAPGRYRSHVARAMNKASIADARAFFRRKLETVTETTAPFGIVDVHGDGSGLDEASGTVATAPAARLRRMARRMSVSAATLFHAAWGLVNARITGREDVVFGTLLFGQMGAGNGGDETLGMFINTLPLRLSLGRLTARELVEHTQQEFVELLDHEQASLMVAQRCSGVAPSTPLFTTLLNYVHGAVSADANRDFAETQVRVLEIHERTNYPIAVSVEDLGETFALRVQTDPRIDARRVLGYTHTAVVSLVEALEKAAQTPALMLSIVPEYERLQMLELFNSTQAPYPQEKTVHELFEEQVRRAPDAVAVVCAGRSLTFAELDRRADQLARYLIAKGVGPDQFVGICVERSLEMLVGLLGILKAGGAYVPLDPAYPPARVAYILRDAAPGIVIAQQDAANRFGLTGDACVLIDAQWDVIARQDSADLETRSRGLTSRHLAYVIYTSGSTGEPKGVMVEHRNVVNHWKAVERLYRQPAECRRIALNAPFTFDASVQQLVQLLSGRSLVVVPQTLRLDPQALLNFMEEHDVQGIDCTPSQLNAWVAAGLLEEGRRMPRTVLVGGEAIEPSLWQRLAKCAGKSFYNVYGPTECTVDSTAALLADTPEQPHIGRPLENSRIYILDAQSEPVPMGVAGEICIGGAGVARGYLNRPELTKQRFAPDPFSRDPQARLYRTGDVARWRTDGSIEYLGRNDHQVKIRGFRIELGEIEAQLAQHAAVKDAVVLAREDVPGEKRLVAYVVPAGERPDVEAFRAHLKASLPEYMVPSAFVVLARLPLTPSGKLDRQALPPPELGALASRQYEAPEGEVEEVLAQIWESVLRVARVGRQDNFFELGGDSLLAMQATARIRQRLFVEMPVSALFAWPCVSGLAGEVNRRRETLLASALAEGGGEIEELLERVGSMPESKVQELVQQMRVGTRS